MTAVTAALAAELQAFLPECPIPSPRSAHQGFAESVLDRHGILAAVIGSGKSLSAYRIGELLERHFVDLVVHIGICGAADASMQTGDMLVPDRVMQHDLHLKEFSLPPGVIPYTGIGSIELSARRSEFFSHIRSIFPSRRIRNGGMIASGDVFASPEKKAELLVQGSCACDMESYSVALGCMLKGVPLIIWKIISDDAAGAGPKRFSRFISDASALWMEGVISYLESR